MVFLFVGYNTDSRMFVLCNTIFLEKDAYCQNWEASLDQEDLYSAEFLTDRVTRTWKKTEENP